MVTKVNKLEVKSCSNMTVWFDALSVLDLLFSDDIELSDSDVSEEEDKGDARYLIDSPLVASDSFSLSEIIDEGLVMELCSYGASFLF